MSTFFDKRIHAIPAEIRADIDTVLEFVRFDAMKDSKEMLAEARIGLYLAKYQKAESDDTEREEIIDHLTDKQEDLLKDAHMKNYHGDKDHYEDNYNMWESDLTFSELKEILDTEILNESNRQISNDKVAE